MEGQKMKAFIAYRFTILVHIITYSLTSLIYIIACIVMAFLPRKMVKKVDVIPAKSVFVDKGVFH